MSHRDDAEALRSKLEAVTQEAAASTARAAVAEEALRVATERIDFLERELGKAMGNAPSRASRMPPARTTKLPRARPEHAVDPAARTPDKRLRDAERFAAEGRSREALQIVLSVHRQVPSDPRVALMLASRVYCARCKQQVTPPSHAAPAQAARFFGGRCPTCQQILDLLHAG